MTTTLTAHTRLESQFAADTTVGRRRTDIRITRRVLTAPLRVVLIVVSGIAIVLVALLQGVAFLAIAGIDALGETPRSGGRQ